MKASLLPALAATAAGVWVLFKVLVPAPPPLAIEIVSSRQCLECHAEVAAEWQASHHAFAYQNPEVQKLSNDFRNEECLSCHAPRPVLLFDQGARVLARNSERILGVDCLACHLVPDGGVATTNPAPTTDAPCRPRTVARLGAADNCAACHNQHQTVEQWRDAPARFGEQIMRGEDCLHCHMPVAWRSGGHRGRNHSFQASHHTPSLQQAVSLSAEVSDRMLAVSLTNSGAAHNFPTDERSRAADLQTRWQNAAGNWSKWSRLHRFRDPYRDETELVNTSLPAGATWSGTLSIESLADAVEVRLLYRTNPFQSDDQAAVVHLVQIDL